MARIDTLEAERITRKGGYTCSPRMAWNSGFWDGVSDAKAQRSRRTEGSHLFALPAWSPFYRAGYGVGYDAVRFGSAAGNLADSTELWEAWRRLETSASIRRMLAGEEGWK